MRPPARIVMTDGNGWNSEAVQVLKRSSHAHDRSVLRLELLVVLLRAMGDQDGLRQIGLIDHRQLRAQRRAEDNNKKGNDPHATRHDCLTSLTRVRCRRAT